MTLDHMQLMLHTAFFPFKDLSFEGQQELIKVAELSHFSRKGAMDARKALLNKLHPIVLAECSPSSLDEINLMVEKFHPYLFKPYFEGIEEPREIEGRLYQHYLELIREFTRALLSHRDGEMVFKYWNHEQQSGDAMFRDVWRAYEELDKVHMFSTLSRLLPIDLFVATYYAVNGLHEPHQLDGWYQHINLADAPLHDVLQQGIAENHIHASAAFTFTMLWERCMNFNGDFSRSAVGTYLANFRPSHSCKSEQVREYMLTAQIIRFVLALYMRLDEDIAVSRWLRKSMRREYPLVRTALFGEEGFLSIEELKLVLENLQKEFIGHIGENGADWMSYILQEYKPFHTYGENMLMHKLMIFVMKRQGKGGVRQQDHELWHLMFRYLCIKNEFYQQVNQSNAVQGLDHFRQYFDRATDGFDSQDHYYYRDMLRNLFQNPYLRKVELRLSIASSVAANRTRIRSILQAYRDILTEDYNVELDREVDFPRVSLVYHLIKQEDHIAKDWQEYEKTGKSEHLYYGRIQQNYIEKVRHMLKLRNNIPYLSNFIVGLDAASLENNTPIHVFAPVFEAARNSDHDRKVMVDRDGKRSRQQSLFFTFHAGEDFRHLNSGLRRIDEVIHYCKFHSGDRIGHGIALGVSVERWVHEHSQVVLPRGEYLDNLLWAWGVYTRSTEVNFKTYSYLQHKIHEVAKDIFGEAVYDYSIEMLYESYQRRFLPVAASVQQEIARFRDWERKEQRSRQSVLSDVLLSYHDQAYLQKQREPVFVRATDLEKEIVMDMQRYVRRIVAEKGIVVEVNPSSNFVIMDMQAWTENQFFQIQQQDQDIPDIIINVNTDDPIVFNTNISNELAYLYYGMLHRGIGRSEALKWIEQVRRSGMDTSFIRDNISNYEYVEQLDCLLASLHDPDYCEDV